MFYEDVVDGAVFRTGSHVVSSREIAEFASRFDPQPMHLDSVFAADLEFGEVIASGFHTMALAWRLWVETGMDTHGRGGLGLDGARWFRPVVAGTVIQCRVRLAGPRLTSRGKGMATMHFDVLDGTDELLMKFTTVGLFARRSDGMD